VCNIGKAKRDFGWIPKVKKEEGIKLLHKWVKENKSYFM
jgi:nucleoside-diphosphate-sugar epimerase